MAVFTGGSLLFGSTGRPDLLGPAHTQALAHAQWHSAQRLAAELPDETAVYPTHGFGSFCSATQSGGTASTIGQEKLANPALTTDESRYVEDLLAGLDAYPAYYAHMGTANSAGPGEVDLSLPPEADPAELRRRIEAGEWVVDLRNRTAFAAGHVGGTVNFGLDGQFVTYLAWLMPWGTPVTLLGETAEDVAEAQRELVRIGIDRPAAMATGRPEDGPAASRCAATAPRFADLAAQLAAGPGHRGPRRAPQPGAGRELHRGLGPHPDPRGARPPRRDPGRRGLGALRRRLPRRRRGRPPRRPRGRRRGDRRLLRQRRPAGLPLTTATLQEVSA